jgi:hypothetical protein
MRKSAPLPVLTSIQQAPISDHAEKDDIIIESGNIT